MAATPQDVQKKIDAGTAALAKSTASYPDMVKKYGQDWHKWPKTSAWYIALSNFAAARAEAGLLIAPTQPHADFTEVQK